MQDFIRLIENQTNMRVKKIRTDNGGEYLNDQLRDFLADRGIRHETTIPETSVLRDSPRGRLMTWGRQVALSRNTLPRMARQRASTGRC